MEEDLRFSFFHRHIELAQRKALEYYLKGLAEDVTTSIDAIDRASARGAINPEAAERNIAVTLNSRKIGDSGYVFVLNSEGIVQFHPKSELIGEDFSELPFIRQQISLKTGYLEYSWANPGELDERSKALYMTYYELRDWIVSVSAYKEDFPELITPNDISDLLENVTSDGSNIYLIDPVGQRLITPSSGIQSYSDQSIYNQIAQAVEQGSDRGEFITNPGGLFGVSTDNRILEYSSSRDFGWILVSEINQERISASVRQTLILPTIISLLSVVIAAIILFTLGRMIGQRLSHLHHMITGDVVLPAVFTEVSDEISDLANALYEYRREITQDREVLESFARFVNESPMPILQVDQNWNCLIANPAASLRISPVVVDEHNTVHPEWREQLSQCFTQELGEISINGRRYLLSHSGSIANGDVYIAFLDISISDQFQTLLSLWRNMFDHSIEGITITDDKGRIERVNRSFSSITGYSSEEAVGAHTRILKSGSHTAQFYHSMWQALESENLWEGEIWNRRKNGEIYPEWLCISAFEEQATGKRKYMAIFHDNTRVKNQERILNRLDSVDAITGLPNRDRFFAMMDSKMSKVTVLGETAAIVVLCLDDYSRINSSLGIPVGESVLRWVSEIVSQSIRGEDQIARLEDDKFGIILDDYDKTHNKIEVLDRILSVVGDGLSIEDRTLRVTITSGVAFIPDDGSDLYAVMSNAHDALDRAQRTSRGSYAVYDKILDGTQAEELEFEFALRNALSNKELYLEYQPIYSTQTRRPVSFEALIRWRRSNGNIVPPDRFIPIAEALDLMVPIGNWVIGQVCEMISTIGSESVPRVAINISAHQFSDPALLEVLLNQTQANGISPHNITLEITERVAASESEDTTQLLKQLSSHGFMIAIDDFGTGYSSLKYIRDYTFDILKIDKSFVENLGNPKGLAIVRAIISMGKALNKSIVAEGVENNSEFELLNSMECDYIQGYFFSKPISESKVESIWLDSNPVGDSQPIS